jgi:hypothetical protein
VCVVLKQRRARRKPLICCHCEGSWCLAVLVVLLLLSARGKGEI